MSDLRSALDSAFEEERSTPAPEAPSTPSEPSPEATEPAAAETPEEPEEAAQAAPEAAQDEDVLLERLTPEDIVELKKTEHGRRVYKGLMQSYTQKMQKLAERDRQIQQYEQLWNALNNPATQRQAVEALAKATGIQVAPGQTEQKQAEQASQIADKIQAKWDQLIGPEAAAQFRPVVEDTIKFALSAQIEPLQKAIETQQELQRRDMAMKQADAQLQQFMTFADKEGWKVSKDVEKRMTELGQQLRPAKAFETVEEGVGFLKQLYRLATADTSEADTEKRILARMNKAAQTAEPARGVPSAGKSKPSGITKEMSLNEALDVAMQETLAERR